MHKPEISLKIWTHIILRDFAIEIDQSIPVGRSKPTNYKVKESDNFSAKGFCSYNVSQRKKKLKNAKI